MVDVIYHADLCNVLLKKSREFWLKLLQDSCLLGVLVAPACETWSAVRWLRVHHGASDSGPPPVRDRRSPWGLRHVSLKHMRQTDQSSLLFVAWATKMGVSWTLEHPAEPSIQEAQVSGGCRKYAGCFN